MPDIQLGGVPFEEAARFFRDKVRLPTKAWTDLKEGMHARAFVVAGATKDELLKDLQDSIQRAIDNGTGLAQFRKDFGAIVAKHGWSYTGDSSRKGRAWRTKVIFETNLSTARAAGRWEQIQRVKGRRPWLRYVAILDTHVRPDHRRWHGTVLPVDDEWWQTHYPPNGWNCFPGETMVRCDARIGLRAWYSGEMVELHTRLGHRLTVTANHPVLTGRGWIAAHALEKGDELLGASGNVDSPLPGVVDDEHPPARAENLFEALATQGLRVVPVAAYDFHGDALAMEGEVHVAGADGALVNIIEAATREFVGEGRLQGALHRAIKAADVGVGAPFLPPVVGNAVLDQGFPDGGLRPTETLTDSGRADEAAAIERQGLALDRVVAPASGFPCRGALPLDAAGHGLDLSPFQPFGFGPPPEIDARLSQSAADCVTGAAPLVRQLLEAGAGAVARDQIVEIRKFQWSGHVYDFSTRTGLILAGGIVVSNCRCTVMSLSTAQMTDFGYEPSKAPPQFDPVRRKDPFGDGTIALDRGIDPGFNYNVGMAHVGLERAIPEGFAKTRNEWKPIEGGAYRTFTPADYGDAAPLPVRPLPKLGPPARDQAEMVDLVKQEIGGDRATLTTPDGTAVSIDAEIFGGHVPPRRAIWLPVLRDLVENPQEAWLIFERNERTGQVALRRRHLALYDNPDSDRRLLMIFQAQRSVFEAWTFVPVDRAGYLEARRSGLRLWPPGLPAG